MPSETAGEPPGTGASELVCRVLAGLDTAVAAGMAVVLWLSIDSWMRGEFWWARLNVAGAIFYDGAVYSMGLGRATLAGGALLLAIYSLLGAGFGLIARKHGYARNMLSGLLLALAWQFVADRYVWRRLDTFATLYFPALATLPGHLIFGLGLARFASRYRRVATTFGDERTASEFVPVVEPAAAAAPETAPAESPAVPAVEERRTEPAEETQADC